MAALQCAEIWGQHPEDIMQRRRGMLWNVRRVVYEKASAKAKKNAQKKW